ncbi:hypothetical protein GCM10007242_16770 [Pigmentiphaga litoralis]|nr:hypothetical protein GCM10007242_16770 [Pigmentiphaga litoralis]
MEKTLATKLLGGTPSAAAEAIGITPQAYGQWPDPLPRRLEDRVVAAIARRHLRPELIGGSPRIKAKRCSKLKEVSHG